MRRERESKQPLSGRPLLWALLWGFALLWGVVGSVFAPSLATLANYDPFPKWWAIAYWLVLLGMVVVVAYQRQDEAKQNREHDEQLFRSLDQVHEMVRTLPPDAFTFALGASYQAQAQSTLAVLTESPSPRRDDLDKKIRSVLLELTSLTATFDEAREEERYAANIMLYRPTDSLTAEDLAVLFDQKALKFWQLSSLDRCSGVLWLDKELSTDSGDKKPEPDRALPSVLGLPVWDDREGTGIQVLPGAPRAWLTSSMMTTRRISEFLEEAKDRGKCDVPTTVLRMMEEYFQTGEGKDVGSFVAVPIMAVSYDEDPPTAKCIAVLNIHRKSSGILRTAFFGENEPPRVTPGEKFQSMIAPYLALLSLLLEARSNAGKHDSRLE